MRKIHSHLAEVVDRGFGDIAIKKRLNRNILYTRDADWGDVNISIYDKLTYKATFKKGEAYALFLDAPMSVTYKGYINAILNGFGANSHFYIKNGKAQCKDLKRDGIGLYLKNEWGLIRINFTDKALNDYAYNDITGGVK